MKYNKSPFEFDPDEFLGSKIKFGKYKGLTWIELIKVDPGYAAWASLSNHLTLDEQQTLVEAIELDDQ